MEQEVMHLHRDTRGSQGAGVNRHSSLLRRGVFLWLALVLPLAPLQAEPPERYPFIAYDAGLRLAQQQQRRVFLYFGRYGCGWCEKTNKESFSDPEVRKRYIDHYVLVYVDAESGARLTLPNGEQITERELGVRLKVFATPVFVYLEPGGRKILQAPGFKTAQDFLDFDRYVHGGHYRTMKLMQFLSGPGK